MKRYEKLVSDIMEAVCSGTLQSGDRLPSVRQSSATRGISASTVFKAYYALEAQGIIRARAGSGYYVAARCAPAEKAPADATASTAAVAPDDTVTLIQKLLLATERQSVIPFGSAYPSPALFPIRQLARSMGEVLPRADPWSSRQDRLQGNMGLRRQIALRYLADGMRVDPDEIVITSGSLDALHLSLLAVARPGDAVAIASPAFYGALRLIRQCGMRAIEVPAHPIHGIDLDALAQALRIQQVKACLAMPNFQHPLGSVMTVEKKQALVALLTLHGVPLIEDDSYGELYFSRHRPPPAKAFDRCGMVLHCSSFSKCLAPGYRVGWAIPGRFLQSFTQHKLFTTPGPSLPSQLALSDYLGKGAFDKHLRRLRQTLQRSRDAMMEALRRYVPGATVIAQPQGSYFLWVRLKGGIDAVELHRQALSGGISIAPGTLFSPPEDFGNFICLNYGYAWDAQMDAAMQRLGHLVAAQAGRHETLSRR